MKVYLINKPGFNTFPGLAKSTNDDGSNPCMWEVNYRSMPLWYRDIFIDHIVVVNKVSDRCEGKVNASWYYNDNKERRNYIHELTTILSRMIDTQYYFVKDYLQIKKDSPLNPAIFIEAP